ncbi:MAG: CoA transferase [Dehalococcoidia bacterium]|nr:CoA transferase [Dehalococcoidia bacterium]
MASEVFKGIKVADFAWVSVGPRTSEYLAEYGATVVRIESRRHYDPLRTTGPYRDNKPGVNLSGFYARYNLNKYSVTLNLAHPKGVEVARLLVKWADIVTDSFSPGVMRRWGLSYEDLVKIKPDIIMMSASLLGQTGPSAGVAGFGLQLTSIAGFHHLVGWPDRAPVTIYGAYTDALAPRLQLAALVAALIYRRKTGKGQYLDVSQLECALQFLAPVFLDYVANGRVWNRMGNRCPYAAPHGAFRCQGEDKWCTIAVFTDQQWGAFAKVLGNPKWTNSPKFATFLDRKKNEDELERLVEEWTKDFTPEEVMKLMQAVGVPAGIVATAEDVYKDPQLEHRQHFTTLSHPEMRAYPHERSAAILSKSPGKFIRPAPCLGEHNYYVYTELLGMPEEEFIQLLNEQVFD